MSKAHTHVIVGKRHVRTEGEARIILEVGTAVTPTEAELINMPDRFQRVTVVRGETSPGNDDGPNWLDTTGRSSIGDIKAQIEAGELTPQDAVDLEMLYKPSERRKGILELVEGDEGVNE